MFCLCSSSAGDVTSFGDEVAVVIVCVETGLVTLCLSSFSLVTIVSGVDPAPVSVGATDGVVCAGDGISGIAGVGAVVAWGFAYRVLTVVVCVAVVAA